MKLSEKAMLIALEVHAGDRNKHDGEMYTLHLARVYCGVRERGGSEIQQAIAWLHDSIEDTPLNSFDLGMRLREQGVSFEDISAVINGVEAMTKVKGETLEDYYSRVKSNPDARFVKLHGDIVDNFRRNHKIKDPDTRLRMAKKYSLGIDMLAE